MTGIRPSSMIPAVTGGRDLPGPFVLEERWRATALTKGCVPGRPSRMRLRALRYRLARPGEGSLDVMPWAGLPDELAEKQAPSVYLVPEQTVFSLRALDRTFNDRGRKHPARALGAILLRQPRVPLVAAPLTSGSPAAAQPSRAARPRRRGARAQGLPDRRANSGLRPSRRARWRRRGRFGTMRAWSRRGTRSCS